jgi:hypothetical protein
MAKEAIYISGTDLVAALERICALMKAEVKRDPELAYHVADGSGLDTLPSLAVVFTFEPETMRHKSTKICSEKRAAKEWNKANGIRI